MKWLSCLCLVVVLSGCGGSKKETASPTPPPVATYQPDAETLRLATERDLKEWSANPVGKYQIQIHNDAITRFDTQTGKLWLLIPANSTNNITGRPFWKAIAE